MHTGLSSGGPGSLLWSWPASFLLTHICKDVVCGLAAYPSTFYNFAPLNLFIFLRLSYSFFWPRPQYVKVPGPGIEHTPQQWQHLIPNPLHHQGTPKPSHCCLCAPLLGPSPLCLFVFSSFGDMLSFTLTAFVELMDHGIVSWDTFSVAFIKKVIQIALP